MLKILIPVLVVGGLLASGAAFSLSGKDAAAPSATEVVLGCCGEPKPCDSCTCDEAECGDECGTGGTCSGEKAAACCDDAEACLANGGPPAGCCGGAGEVCCGQCGGKCEEMAEGAMACEGAPDPECQKACDEAKMTAEETPAKACCGGGGE